MRIKFNKIIVTIFFIFFLNPCFAIEDNSSNKAQTVKLTSHISYDEVLKDAKEHAFDLKIANFQTQIAKTGIISARSDYFPKLNFMAGTEYTKNYKDRKDTTTMSIGEAFINPYTRYQSVLGITLSYNVFDFGVRKSNLERSKEDVKAKTVQEERALQELELNLIDMYTRLILASKQIKLSREVLEIDKNTLDMTKRLLKAKQISKTDLNDRTLKIAKDEKQISELNQIIEESLSWLSFYTGVEYDAKNLKVENLAKSDFNPMVDVDNKETVLWRYYDFEIKKKELELKITKRANLPKVSAYSRYYLYGSNHSSYPDSFKDFDPSNFSVGANVTMPVFDGLKNYADIKKASLELQQVEVERDKAIAEWETRLVSMRNNYKSLEEQQKSTDAIIKELNDKKNSKTRLLSSKLISPIELNDTKVELLEEEMENIKCKVTKDSMQKAIQILIEY